MKRHSDAALNPDHTHFLLVDDGSYKEFGVEISFRNELEEQVRKSEIIPIVLMVVEGGVGTIETVLLALKKKIPIILMKANKIIYCCEGIFNKSGITTI
jgi:hypothetical protein